MPPAPGPGGRNLFVSSFPPTLGNGRALRTYMVVRALAALGPLDLAYVPFGAEEPDAAFQAIDGLAFHVVRPSRGARRAVRYATLCAQGVPPAVARAASSPELGETAERMAALPGRNQVVAGDFNVMVTCLRLARRRPVIYNSHNVESSYRVEPASGRRDAFRLRHTERRILSAAAESWMVSRRDVELARALEPEARLRYVPNVVDAATIVPVTDSTEPRDEVLMVGDYSYEPNATGATWLAREVMPRVRAARPAARLVLVGRGAREAVGASGHVDTPGFVENLRDRYATAGAVAVPLLRGGGTPLKFIEALAHGVPVVATKVAAQGLDLTAGEEYRRADDADGFAGELIEVLAHGDTAMAARARARVEEDFSLEALIRLMRA